MLVWSKEDIKERKTLDFASEIIIAHCKDTSDKNNAFQCIVLQLFIFMVIKK